jgi:(5-formylfuran-3-yl)methyl phosphate synthase
MNSVRLLVSVRSADEARVALASGVDLIDVKEPSAGSLGAASDHTLREVAGVVGDKAPLSAALGELRDFHPRDKAALAGYRYAKLGLVGALAFPDWQQRWRAALAQLPPGVRGVAVAYADHRQAESPSPATIAKTGHALGCRALLIDTYAKNRGGLLEAISVAELRESLQIARSLGLMTVLAGSLSLERLEEVLGLQPDVVAVRGAVCRGDRSGALAVELVEQWRERLGGSE